MLKKVIDTKMSVRQLEEAIKGDSPKEVKEEKPAEQVASTSAFVNDNPLIPTAELPEDTSNYGKVTIAPPTEGGDDDSSKFINYGELNKDDDDDDDDEGGSSFAMPPAVTSIDIDKAKEAAQDINTNNGGADLDSLLNLGNPTSPTPTNQFITPAEKIVKTDPGEDFSEKSSDYFKMPEELSGIDNSDSIINPMDNNMMFVSDSEPEKPSIPIVGSMFDDPETHEAASSDMFSEPIDTPPAPVSTGMTVEEASDKIRDLVNELKINGINIKTDEMNFEKSYQIIIKIDKTGN